ncbi:hypothetical protein BT69DRAFT_792286 [Atractiella rhizophila]|nr:hypothetical protein BT69DRAFT_792286 [Atractiella rhizophila]
MSLLGMRGEDCGRKYVAIFQLMYVSTFIPPSARGSSDNSHQELLDVHERATYGALTGDLNSVLPLCTTWHDALWAQLNSLFESKVDTFLPPNQKWEEDEMRTRWEGSTKSNVAKACEEVKAYEGGKVWHFLEKAIIVAREGEVVGHMADGVTELGDEFRIHLLRFLSHFILFLKALEIPLPPKESNDILRMYVESLEHEFKDENLLAFYASFLEAEDAHESYAHFLRTFDLKTTLEQRREALFKAHANGLDIAKVAERVHELLLQDMDLEVPSLQRVQLDGDWAPLKHSQLEMLRGLEWLQFDSNTFARALVESNKLALFFFAGGQIHAACEVQDRLPPDFLQFTAQTAAAKGQLEETQLAREIGLFDDLRSMCDIVKWIRQFNILFATGQDEQRVRDLVEDMYTEIIPMLQKDWLLPKFQSADMTEQNSDLGLISLVRRLYIPELVLSLHSILYSTRDLISSSLSRAMSLANTVADQKFAVFKEFVTEEENRMPEYLLALREAALVAADKGKGDPFRLVALNSK